MVIYKYIYYHNNYYDINLYTSTDYHIIVVKMRERTKKIARKVFEGSKEYIEAILKFRSAKKFIMDYARDKTAYYRELRKTCRKDLAEQPQRIERMRDKFLRNYSCLTLTEKGIFLKEVASGMKYPIPLELIITEDSLRSCAPHHYLAYDYCEDALKNPDGYGWEDEAKGGSPDEPYFDARFFKGNDLKDGEYNLKKDFEDSDLIKVVDLFDFVPREIPAQFVSHGLFVDWTRDGQNYCKTDFKIQKDGKIRHNACSPAGIQISGHSHGNPFESEDIEFMLLHLVDFDRLCGIEGLTDYTVKLTKLERRKQTPI